MLSRYRFWLIIVFLLLIFIVGIVNKDLIRSQLDRWNLLPKPEKFTELYFDNHQQLPSIIKEDKEYTFRFVTHNLEHETLKYDYEVKIASESSKLLDKGSFILKHNQSKVIKEKLSLHTSIPKTKIEVNLINKGQKIHFWIVGFYLDNGKSNSNNSLSQ